MKKERIIGKCNLCNETKKLCDSHIIPAAFFRKIRDKDTRKLVAIGTDVAFNTQNLGFWVHDILCEKCDNEVLGIYDNYSQKFFFQDWEKCRTKVGCFLPEYDYHKLKKFLISVLWKVSMSNENGCEKITLGKKYNEECRGYLLNEIADVPNVTIILRKIRSMNKVFDMTQIAFPIFHKKMDGKYNFYYTFFGGFEIVYKVGYPSQRIEEKGTLNPTYWEISEEDFSKSNAILSILGRAREVVDKTKLFPTI